MNPRFKKLISLFRENGIDAFLITKDINISYLAGFSASESWLFVTRRKVYYITDFRYAQEAKKGLKGITVKLYTKSIFDIVSNVARAHKIKRIGFDDRHLTVRSLRQLKKASGKNSKWISIDQFVEKFRTIKQKHELTQIRKSLRLNLKAYKYIERFLKPGTTEQEIKDHLERYIKSHNALFSFDPIVASGPNSCFPHAKVTKRKLRNNESVLIDMGVDIGGYKSDLTRMFFLGKIPHSVEEVYAYVRTAQRRAISKIRPGIKASEVDQEARNYLKKNKLDKFFGHSLGHGVGLEVHESPTISAADSSILKEGMVFTVEPAVYIPGKFGIRIEDMVLVVKKGFEVLSDDIY